VSKYTPESEVPRHHKRRQKRRDKPFKIERRYIGRPLEDWLAKFFSREWHVVRAYETEKQRQSAFDALTHKSNQELIRWEYRLAEIESEPTNG